MAPAASASYNAIETAMLGSGYAEIAYNAIEVAMFGPGLMKTYTNISEVAWIFSDSWVPPPDPTPPSVKSTTPGIVVNSDFSLNVFGLKNLSGQRVRRVDQVPFRLGVLNTNLALRKTRAPDFVGNFKAYSTIAEVAWVLNE